MRIDRKISLGCGFSKRRTSSTVSGAPEASPRTEAASASDDSPLRRAASAWRRLALLPVLALLLGALGLFAAAPAMAQTVELSATTYEVSESAGTFAITVNLSVASSSTRAVVVRISNGTARWGHDFGSTSDQGRTARSYSFTINAGQTSASRSIPIINDSVAEPE